MKNIVKYGRHFLKAKGRHGTHSPFVYAFVEEVLRSRKKYNIDFRTLLSQPGFSKKELTLLIKTILYLEAKVIYCEPQFEQVLNYINTLMQSQNNYKIVVLNTDFITGNKNPEGENILVLAGLKPDIIAKMKLFLSQKDMAWLIPKPKGNADSLQNWNDVCTLPEVKMKLDFWYYGLLMNHQVFKASQYFYLK